MRPPLALLALGWVALAQAGGEATVELQTPRSFGYVIGDIVPVQAIVETDARYRLESNALPKPGPIDRRLWLRRVDAEEIRHGQKVRYRLRLEYQTFYAPLSVKNLTIPAVSLTLAGPGEPPAAQIPAWTFSVTPLRGLAAAEENGEVAARPEIEPKPLETWPLWLSLSAWSGLGMAASAYWAYGLGWLNLGRRGRHFAEAIVALRRTIPNEASLEERKAAYAAVHRAFNRTLGFALFRENLPAFFARHPRYAPVQTEIEAFFAASYAAAFLDEDRTGMDFPLPRLVELCRECIRIERESSFPDMPLAAIDREERT